MSVGKEKNTSKSNGITRREALYRVFTVGAIVFSGGHFLRDITDSLARDDEQYCGAGDKTPINPNSNSETNEHSEQISINFIRSLEMDESGNLLFIGLSGRDNPKALIAYDGENAEWCTDENEQHPKGHVNSIDIGEDGSLYVGTDGEGYFKYKNGGWTKHTQDGLRDERIYDVLKTSSDGVLIAHFSGVDADKGGKIYARLDLTPEGKSDTRIHSVLQHPTGEMWLGTIGGGVFQLNEGGWTHYGEDIFGTGNIRDMEFDKKGDIWVAMDGGVGLARFEMGEGKWVMENPPGKHLVDVELTANGEPVVADWQEGAFWNRDGEWVQITDLPSHAIAIGKEGGKFEDAVFVGTVQNGLVKRYLSEIE